MWTVRWHWLRSRCCPTITTICLQTLFFFPNGNAVPMKQAFLCVSHPVFPAGSLWPPVLTFYSWHPPLSLCGYVFLSLNSCCVLSINPASWTAVSPIFLLGGLLSLEVLCFPWEPQPPWMAVQTGERWCQTPIWAFPREFWRTSGFRGAPHCGDLGVKFGLAHSLMSGARLPTPWPTWPLKKFFLIYPFIWLDNVLICMDR